MSDLAQSLAPGRWHPVSVIWPRGTDHTLLLDASRSRTIRLARPRRVLTTNARIDDPRIRIMPGPVELTRVHLPGVLMVASVSERIYTRLLVYSFDQWKGMDTPLRILRLPNGSPSVCFRPEIVRRILNREIDPSVAYWNSTFGCDDISYDYESLDLALGDPDACRRFLLGAIIHEFGALEQWVKWDN